MTAHDPTRLGPLDAVHRALGAKMVPFGGWEMPVSYPTGTLDEHLACRRSAAVFDVSHLGTVRLAGPGSFDRLQSTLTNDLTRIAPGRAQYTHLLDEDGGVADDIIVWWVGDDRFDVMPNASNTAGVVAAIGGVDVTEQRAVLAVQGPSATALLEPIAAGVSSLPRFAVTHLAVAGVDCTVAATGYSGERGVEIAVPVDHAAYVWDAIVSAGVVPAGLGARDTLRLEAALPLHGHELGAGISPLQAGLGWVVRFDKPSFIGRDALLAERERGVARTLVGIATDGRRPSRQRCAVRVADEPGVVIGEVSSGNFSPVLGHGIALAFVATGSVGDGSDVVIDVRGSDLSGRVVPTPFVAKR
jgi:aminomethyltransferase